jgi:hypothetical protein
VLVVIDAMVIELSACRRGGTEAGERGRDGEKKSRETKEQRWR